MGSHQNPSESSTPHLNKDRHMTHNQPKIELDMTLSLSVQGQNTWSLQKTIASGSGENLLQSLMSILTQEQQQGIENDVRSGILFLSNSIGDGPVNMVQSEQSQSSNEVHDDRTPP